MYAGLKVPVPTGTHVLVTLRGPGVFLGLEVNKQGGTNDITFVILDIDGRNVTNLSYAAAANLGLTQPWRVFKQATRAHWLQCEGARSFRSATAGARTSGTCRCVTTRGTATSAAVCVSLFNTYECAWTRCGNRRRVTTPPTWVSVPRIEPRG